MTDISQKVKAVIGGVELHDVRLTGANVRTRVRDASKLANADLSLRHGAQIIARSDDGFLIGAMVRAQVTSPEENDQQEPLIEMVMTFSLEYVLPNASTYDDAVLNAFATGNGVFNAWPYWREYVQQTAARMGFPPLVLPVFRIERPKRPTTMSNEDETPPVSGTQESAPRKQASKKR